MTIILALVSALAYGLSDFIGGIVSRGTSAWAVAVVAQVSSTLCTTLVALFVPGDPAPADFVWALVGGTGTGVGTAFLYRGFASGRMGVVAPVSAVGAAVVPVLVGVASGERPGALVWLGIVIALPGVWFVSSTPEGPSVSDVLPDSPAENTAEHTGTGRHLPPGLLDAVLAGVGFGVLFAALGQISASAGLWPLAFTQLVSVPAVILLATVLGGAWLPRGRRVRWAVFAGPLGATATGSFLLATQQGFLTVAGVLASLYPATTVLLAALVLRERIHRLQGIGLALCAAAIGFVAGG